MRGVLPTNSLRVRFAHDRGKREEIRIRYRYEHEASGRRFVNFACGAI